MSNAICALCNPIFSHYSNLAIQVIICISWFSLMEQSILCFSLYKSGACNFLASYLLKNRQLKNRMGSSTTALVCSLLVPICIVRWVHFVPCCSFLNWSIEKLVVTNSYVYPSDSGFLLQSLSFDIEPMSEISCI